MSLVFYYDDTDMGVSVVRLGAIDGLEMDANQGTVASSTLPFDDPAGALDLTPLRTVRIVETTASPQTIFYGYAAGRRVTRGSGASPSLLTGASRLWNVDFVDINTLFSSRVVTLTTFHHSRPEEDEATRLTWALSHVMGSILADNGLVTSGSSFTYSANDYAGQFALDVMTDLMGLSGKNFFAYWDDTAGEASVAYFDPDSTTYSSTARLTNVKADVDDSVTFAARGDWSADPSDVYSGVFMIGNKVSTYVTAANRVIIRDVVAPESNVSSHSHLVKLATAYLNRVSTEQIRLNVSVRLPAAHVNDILPGQRVQVKFSHLPVYTSYTYIRVLSRVVKQDEQDTTHYNVDYELGSPRLVSFKAGAGSVPITQPNSGSETPTLPEPPTITDDFNRPSTAIVAGTSTLGTASCGRVWVRDGLGAAAIDNLQGNWDDVGGGSNANMYLPGPWPLDFDMTVRVVSTLLTDDNAGLSVTVHGTGPTGPLVLNAIWGGASTAQASTLNVTVLDGSNTAAATIPITDYSAPYTPHIVIDSTGISFTINSDTVTVAYASATPSPIGAPTDLNGHLNINTQAHIDDLNVASVTGTAGVSGTAGEIYGPYTIGYGDGSTQSFFTPYPYQSGTLQVFIDGVLLAATEVTETDPTTGEFNLATAPSSGQVIRVVFRIAVDAGQSQNGTAVYGSAMNIDTKANIRVGDAGGPLRKVSHRFRFTDGPNLTDVRFSQRGGVGYSSQNGNGGTIVITVEADVGGKPSGTPLATQNYSPANPLGTWTTYDNVTFSSPPTLTIGNLYHIVYTNSSSSGVNYISINHVFVYGSVLVPRQPEFDDTDLAVLAAENGSTWVVQGQYTPVLDVTNDAGGHDGQAYIGNIIADYGTINGASDLVRQTITDGLDLVVTSMAMRVRRTSGTDPLTGTLKTAAGTVVEAVDVPYTVIPASAPGLDNGGSVWAVFTFTSSHTLTSGIGYQFVLSTAAGSTYTAAPILQGDSVGFQSFAFRSGSGQSSTDGGATWSDLYAFDDVDTQFYFTTI